MNKNVFRSDVMKDLRSISIYDRKVMIPLKTKKNIANVINLPTRRTFKLIAVISTFLHNESISESKVSKREIDIQ